MSAEKLREAAKVLRERAEGSGCEFGHQWRIDGMYQVVTVESDPPGAPVFGCMACEADQDSAKYAGYPYTTEDTATYIATMHPGVGLALADWLDDEARAFEHPQKCDDARGCCNNCEYDASVLHAIAVADAILGGAQ